MHVRGGRRDAIEKQPPRLSRVAARILRRHEAVVAPEPMHALPRNLLAVGLGREQPVEALGARSAGENHGKALARLGEARQQTLRRRLRQRLPIGKDGEFGTPFGHRVSSRNSRNSSSPLRYMFVSRQMFRGEFQSALFRNTTSTRQITTERPGLMVFVASTR